MNTGKSFASVCKNIIAQNNKRGWIDPLPAIRIAKSKSGKVEERSHAIGIMDANGNIVARLFSHD